jgi:glycine/D-amino acid oxidase-like deaminating enzyme
MKAIVVGGGIFGVTAALALRRRGHAVELLDPGPLPHPLAESTDISKVVRCDYGGDLGYTELGERALAGWRAWNAAWPRALFHETGVMFLSRAPMQPGGFEHDSFALLAQRGHHVERLDAHTIAARFPAYREGALVDGYYHREGGWAEAGAVVAQLAADCRAAGVTVHAEHVNRLADLVADAIVVCAGAWTQALVPELAGMLTAVGQPVFHLRPHDPQLFFSDHFPVFGADIAHTGYYGFPLHAGVVKIANHGTGIVAPVEREVTAEQIAALRAFVAETFPALAGAELVATRLCVYGDSRDGDFLIAQHPAWPELTVAAGGSGHAFKFAPVLGELIADAVAGRSHPRFAWRTSPSGPGDAARHQNAAKQSASGSSSGSVL